MCVIFNFYWRWFLNPGWFTTYLWDWALNKVSVANLWVDLGGGYIRWQGWSQSLKIGGNWKRFKLGDAHWTYVSNHYWNNLHKLCWAQLFSVHLFGAKNTSKCKLCTKRGKSAWKKMEQVQGPGGWSWGKSGPALQTVKYADASPWNQDWVLI